MHRGSRPGGWAAPEPARPNRRAHRAMLEGAPAACSRSGSARCRFPGPSGRLDRVKLAGEVQPGISAASSQAVSGGSDGAGAGGPVAAGARKMCPGKMCPGLTIPQHSRAWPAEGSESGRAYLTKYLMPFRPVWCGLRKTKCLLSSSPGRPLVACAVQRRRFPVGANPTRPTRSSRKQPEQSWR
jgi:hypothetical protein